MTRRRTLAFVVGLLFAVSASAQQPPAGPGPASVGGGGGGGGTPSSPVTSFQYNNSGAFGGTSFNFVADQIVATAVTPGTPSIVASDATSGFAFDAAGLPGLVAEDNFDAFLSDTAGASSSSAGLLVSRAGNIAIAAAPRTGSGGDSTFEHDSFGSSKITKIISTAANGTQGTPTAKLDGQHIFQHQIKAYGTTDYAFLATVRVDAAQDITDASSGASYAVATSDILGNSVVDRLVVDGSGNTNILNGAGRFGNPTAGSEAPGYANVEHDYLINGASISALFATAAQGAKADTALQPGGVTEHISYQPGLLTAVNATKAAFHKFSKASTVDNIEGSAATFSCVANPVVTVFECGTSATCASPTTIGTVTVTAAGTVADGSISNAAIAAGDYVAFAMTGGTCASVDIAATVQTHVN